MWKHVSGQAVALALLGMTLAAQAPGPRPERAAGGSPRSPQMLRMIVAGETLPAATPVPKDVLFGEGTGLNGSTTLIFSVARYSSNPTATPLATFNGILLDIGIDPTTQELYVIDNFSGLWRLDLTALTATLMGTGASGANALVFNAAGQAYEWGSDQVLYRVDKSSGVATAVGDTGFASAGDLAFDLDGTLYGTTIDGELIRIDPNTGASTLVGPTGFDDFFGLAIDGTGTLYAGRGSQSSTLSEIYRIDKNSGTPSFVGSISNDNDSVGGLALVASSSAPESLYLNNNRFKVDVHWTTSGGSGSGTPVKLTSDTGYLWFFTASNVEMVIKVLNGCGVGGHYWVFAGGLTNVATQITVTDTQTGASKTYRTVAGPPFQPIQDTSAFATCP
jgi:hypothetical protein